MLELTINNIKIYGKYENTNNPFIIFPGGPFLLSNYLLDFFQIYSPRNKIDYFIFNIPTNDMNFDQISKLFNQAIEKLAWQYKIKQFYVLGHSLGALFTLNIPTKLIKHLFLISTPISLTPSDKFKKRKQEVLAINIVSSPKEYLHTIMPLYFSSTFTYNLDNLISKNIPSNKHNIFPLPSVHKNLIQRNILKTATHVIGKNDILFSQRDIFQLQEIISPQKINLLDSGHFPMIEQPEKLMQIVKNTLHLE